MAAKVLTIAQQKGGAGKTTLAAQLAVAFALAGRRVAAIDIDPQASLAHWHRVRSERIVAGAPASSLTVSEVTGWRLGTELARLQHTHDLIVVDSPPHAETEAKAAVRSAHLVLLPVQPSPMDLWATGPTVEIARSARVPLLIVLNRVPPRGKVVEITRARLLEQDLPVARTVIGNRVPYASSMLEGRTVLELSPKSAASAEIRGLVEEIDGRLR